MKLAKNYIYSLIYQFTIVILPFITIPYVTRVLGKEGLGIAAYTNSISLYFVYFGLLGISLYGNRAIAYVNKNNEERNKTFWEIYSLQFFMSLISLLVYLIFIYFGGGEYKIIFIVQSTLILANLFDISWLFMGMEDFKKTVSRSFAVKILSLALIFIFVKTHNDLWAYVFITSFIGLISNIIMWGFIREYIDLKKFRLTYKGIKKHFMPSLALFVPQIAVQIYFLSDRTMLGIFSSISETGIYDMAAKIVKMFIPFIVSFSAVMMPRIASLYAEGDHEKIKNYTEKSLKFSLLLAFPFALGLFSISNNFVPWFMGSEFLKVSLLLKINCLMIITSAIGCITGTQLLIPTGKQKEYSFSVIAGAVANIVLNLLLIPVIGSIGACISIVITGWVVCIIQLHHTKEYLDIKNIYKEAGKYFIAAALMLITVFTASIFMQQNLISTVMLILLGMLVYCIFIFMFKCELAFEAFGKIKELLKLEKTEETV